MSFWLIQSLNSLALGGVLFTLAAGFSLIFGLMRIANLSHGAYFMLGAYVGLSVIEAGHSFFLAILAAAVAIGLLGCIVERIILRRLAGCGRTRRMHQSLGGSVRCHPVSFYPALAFLS
jgi:branched-chain amino acid transport system permease protein